MQCEKFEQRLQQLLDDRCDVDQDETLREHAEACCECSSTLRAQRVLFTSMRMIPQSDGLNGVGHRVLDNLMVEQKHRRKRRTTMIALAIAAILLIALLPLAGQRGPWPKNKQPGSGQLALAMSPTERAATRDLSEAEAEELRVLMRHFVGQLSDPSRDMFASVDQLTNSIRPLTLTFNFAIDTLRRSLPGYHDHEPVEPQARFQKLRATIG